MSVEREICSSGSSISRISRTRCSCAGFMWALIRQTATDSIPRARSFRATSRTDCPTPSTTPTSKRGGVEGTLATRDSPESLTAKTSVNVPPVSQPTIHISGQGEGDAAVDEQDLTRNVGRLLAREEEEGVRD